MQLTVEQANEFHQSYQSLDAGLGEAQEKEQSIHSEVEVVKQQLEAHNVRVWANPNPFLSLGSNHHTNKHRSALDCLAEGVPCE